MLDALLVAYMAGVAQGLQGVGPERRLISTMRDYVVRYRGGYDLPDFLAHTAQGIFGELLRP